MNMMHKYPYVTYALAYTQQNANMFLNCCIYYPKSNVWMGICMLVFAAAI